MPPEEPVTADLSLQLADNEAGMELHPSREVQNLLFAKEWTVPQDEIVHIRLRHAEIGSGGVRETFLLRNVLR